MSKVYEIVDYTNGETYYPLGIYPDYQTAKAEIEKRMSNGCISELGWDMDYEEIQIYEREFGWTENGTKVYVLIREYVYDEEKDVDVWKVVSEWSENQDDKGGSDEWEGNK